MASIDLKDIHIGSLIYQRVLEQKINKSQMCNFLNRSEAQVDEIYQSKILNSEILLQLSKLLEYDFFRIYSEHLILYASIACTEYVKDKKKSSAIPVFRKNIYNIGIIMFIVELVESGEKTRKQIIDEYGIPKSTLYKWIMKYKG
ncbi:helix-turn-helix domain-containing protein [Chryseobacterium sp. SIMBA_029]|uniref:helix-turn-helix domain-containing protein n=1 Tax=Chryseobacterium sp. SIMBA_029 TaxID=3085772 RepID=UPI00397E75A0